MSTRAVNLRRERYDVYIGRPGPWGNPYAIGRDGTRAEVIEKYRAYIAGQADLLARLPELRGKRLGCFCKPQACHGDVLAELADSERDDECPQCGSDLERVTCPTCGGMRVEHATGWACGECDEDGEVLVCRNPHCDRRGVVVEVSA